MHENRLGDFCRKSGRTRQWTTAFRKQYTVMQRSVNARKAEVAFGNWVRANVTILLEHLELIQDRVIQG